MIKDRTGEIRKNNNGSIMEIVKYEGRHDIYVNFEKGYPIKTSYSNFLKGKVKNPFEKSVYGVGFLGQGMYKAFINTKKKTPHYQAWQGMLGRCYDEKTLERYPSYKEVTVCEEWHDFQNFAAWYDENFYQIEGEKMHLDKDILIKGNKVYSPHSCLIVPESINKLFVKQGTKRGSLPIGVSIDKYAGKYVAQCSNGGKNGSHYLGLYDSHTEAFAAYKFYKEKLIKRTVGKYKDKLPATVYEALINYQVEITD